MQIQKQTCAACGKPLMADDDIVVCPDCGAPYHRACYEKEGKCLFEAQHSATFTYNQPAPEAQSAPGTEEYMGRSDAAEGLVCPHCGYEKNLPDAPFCTRCGAPLKEPKSSAAGMPRNAADRQYANAWSHTADAASSEFVFGQDDPYATSLGVNAIKQDDEIFGISAKNWATFVGHNAPYYLYQFKHMQDNKRNTSFCWSAVFFAPLYFLYRKCWLWGIISAILFLVVRIPSAMYILALTGSPYAIPMTETALMNLMSAATIANWAICLFWGIFAVYLYRRTAIAKMNGLKQATGGTEEALNAVLHKRSATSIAAVVVAVVALCAVTLGLSLMMLAGTNVGGLYSLYF